MRTDREKFNVMNIDALKIIGWQANDIFFPAYFEITTRYMIETENDQDHGRNSKAMPN